MPELSQGALDSHGPSAVGLMRLSSRLSFPPEGVALYRSILDRAELSEASEFVLIPCGRGRSARFIAEATGAGGAGADPDSSLVGVASDRARRAGLADRLHFESASLDDLPYQDAVFDLALGEIELSSLHDPSSAVGELLRVTKPGGTVVLVQLVWQRSVADESRDELVGRLGLRPRMPTDWERMLSDAGAVGVRVEEWANASGPQDATGLRGLTELFTLRGKVRLVFRAWNRWGWRGVRSVLSRNRELRRLLEEERVLGGCLITGRRRAESRSEARNEEYGE